MVNRVSWLKRENDVAMHYNMCFIGGFLGAYAIFLRGGNFGSAQTGNLIETVLEGLSGEWHVMAFRIGALVIYVLGIILTFLLGKRLKGRMSRICLAVEAVGLVVAAMIPENADPILALYPVFFITSFQWGVFSGAKGYNSATIFSTNNLKQATIGWIEYIRTKDKKQREKAVFYTVTLTAFHLGAAAGCISVKLFLASGAFVGLIPVLCAFGLTFLAPASQEKKVSVSAAGILKRRLVKQI